MALTLYRPVVHVCDVTLLCIIAPAVAG